MSHGQSPLDLKALGRGVLRIDPLVYNHHVLVHGDVLASDHVLLELHLQVIIKKHQHEITQAIACFIYFSLK